MKESSPLAQPLQVIYINKLRVQAESEVLQIVAVIKLLKCRLSASVQLK